MLFEKGERIVLQGYRGKVALADEDLFVFVPEMARNPEKPSDYIYDYEDAEVHSNREEFANILHYKRLD